MTAPSFLFVCLGNICRSPLAEAAFRRAAEAAGLAAHADSAGTGAWHIGASPDPRAIAEARAHGIDISSYRARQVSAQDFRDFTHILALYTQNLADLQAICPPDATARLGLLRDAVAGPRGRSVADPYYGGPRDFAQSWEQVREAAAALVAAHIGDG